MRTAFLLVIGERIAPGIAALDAAGRRFVGDASLFPRLKACARASPT